MHQTVHISAIALAMALSLSKGTKFQLRRIAQPWFVYILLCKDSSYYAGVATDVDNRVKEHNAGQGSKFTRDRTPVKLVYTEEYEDYKGARIKRGSTERMT